MRKLLDKMFASTKLSILIPVAVSLVYTLLYLLLTPAENKIAYVLSLLVAYVFWFFGSFFVVFVQVKNPMCPEGFLNFFELLATFTFCVFGTVAILDSVFHGFQNANPGYCVALITYGSVAWAHSKRKKAEN